MLSSESSSLFLRVLGSDAKGVLAALMRSHAIVKYTAGVDWAWLALEHL